MAVDVTKRAAEEAKPRVKGAVRTAGEALSTLGRATQKAGKKIKKAGE